MYNFSVLKKIIIGVFLNAGALYGVTYVLPMHIQYAGGIAFFALGGLIMGILNSIIKPVLKLFTFPLQILTMGLSLILLNGIIFWIFKFVLDTLVIRGITLQVSTIKSYFLAGLVFGIINWLEHIIVRNK